MIYKANGFFINKKINIEGFLPKFPPAQDIISKATDTAAKAAAAKAEQAVLNVQHAVAKVAQTAVAQAVQPDESIELNKKKGSSVGLFIGISIFIFIFILIILLLVFIK